MNDNLWKPRQAFAHIKAEKYSIYEDFQVHIVQYNPFRCRAYTANDARVNQLLKLADTITVEAEGGELSVCAGYRQRR